MGVALAFLTEPEPMEAATRVTLLVCEILCSQQWTPGLTSVPRLMSDQPVFAVLLGARLGLDPVFTS